MPDLQYLDLTDFTTGLVDSAAAAGGPTIAPQGAAQVTNTYGCYGPPTGGLAPLPGVSTTKTQGLLEAGGYPTGLERNSICDVHIVSPVHNDTAGVSFTSTPDAVIVAYGYFRDAGSGVKERHRVLNYKFGLASPTVFTIRDVTGSSTISAPFRLANGLSIAVGRTSWPSLQPHNPGYPYVAVRTLEDGKDTGEISLYPDPEDTDADGVHELLKASTAGVPEGRWLFNHQDRLCAVQIGGYSSPFGLGLWLGADEIYWSPVNWLSPTDSGAPDNITGWNPTLGTDYVEDWPSGISSWASMNANELFVVKNLGGAFVIRGDMDNPTVVRLPGVESAYGCMTYGAISPLGYAYGTPSGIHVWNGGDVSECLSPQLAPGFWVPDDSTLPQVMKGRFAYSYPWLFFGKNYIYNMQTKGWWRLGNPATLLYRHYVTNGLGDVYAFPNAITATQNVLADIYSTRSLASSFSWQSHPLATTQGRLVDFREIEIVTLGAGTVTVTLAGLGGTTRTESFTVSSTLPQLYRTRTELLGHDVTVKITSTSGTTTAAPSISRVRLGIRERAQVGAS